MVKRDWGLFETFCMKRRWFLYPIVGRIDFNFPLKSRVEPKKEEPKDGEKEEGADEEAKGAPADG